MDIKYSVLFDHTFRIKYATFVIPRGQRNFSVSGSKMISLKKMVRVEFYLAFLSDYMITNERLRA